MQVLQIKSGPRQEQYACFTSESFLQPWISAASSEAIMRILILRNPPCINCIHTKYCKIHQTEEKTVFLIGTGKLSGKGAYSLVLVAWLCQFSAISVGLHKLFHPLELYYTSPSLFLFAWLHLLTHSSGHLFRTLLLGASTASGFETVSKAFCRWLFISLVSPKGFRFFEK